MSLEVTRHEERLVGPLGGLSLFSVRARWSRSTHSTTFKFVVGSLLYLHFLQPWLLGKRKLQYLDHQGLPDLLLLLALMSASHYPQLLSLQQFHRFKSYAFPRVLQSLHIPWLQQSPPHQLQLRLQVRLDLRIHPPKSHLLQRSRSHR